MLAAESKNTRQSLAVPAFRTTAVTKATADLGDLLWRASQDADDILFRPPDEWWPLSGWSHVSSLLWRGTLPVGIVGLAPSAFPGRAEARLSLAPVTRTPTSARHAVEAALQLAAESGYEELVLALPGAAAWARAAASEAGFEPSHTFQVLERPASVSSRRIERSLEFEAVGVERLDELLAALNAAYEGSPDFVPIARATLAAELAMAQSPFVVAKGESGEILATAHLRFSASATNPSGGPYAWVSNLTVMPAAQGLGLGRKVIRRAVAELHAMGALSVTLGVDSRNLRAVRLYESEGFQFVGELGFWSRLVPSRRTDPVR